MVAKPLLTDTFKLQIKFLQKSILNEDFIVGTLFTKYSIDTDKLQPCP